MGTHCFWRALAHPWMAWGTLVGALLVLAGVIVLQRPKAEISANEESFAPLKRFSGMDDWVNGMSD